MHLPGQGACSAVGTRVLGENAKLDRELHDSMPLREFKQPNLSPSPRVCLSFSGLLSVSRPLSHLAVFLDQAPLSLFALMLHPLGTVCLSLTEIETQEGETREGPACCW